MAARKGSSSEGARDYDAFSHFPARVLFAPPRESLTPVRPGLPRIMGRGMRQTSRFGVAGTVLGAVLGMTAPSLASAAQTVYPTPFYTLSAQLTAKQEVTRPQRAARAFGSFTGRLTVSDGRATLIWQLHFMKLTGKPSAVQISYGDTGTIGHVAIWLCPPPSCVSGLRGTYSWERTAKPKLLQALLYKPMYVNVRTQLNANGEIRGQVSVIAPAAGG
jgi:hypothetical protein